VAKISTIAGILLAWLLSGCSGLEASPAAPPPCDLECQDQVAMRALREGIKLIYNIKLQGKPVGKHDEMAACPQAGKARVFGTAFSNAEQGATEVELTYVFTDCKYVHADEAPAENYQMTATGSITQTGIIAVQPSATTALLFHSDSLSVDGSLYDPPLLYEAQECTLDLAQSGNDLNGTWCGRQVGLVL
jgi:hypothetical protein